MNNMQLTLSPPLIFAIVVGLVVLAMTMSGKNKNRSSMGWWIGLAVLLFITSGFFGLNSMRSKVEQRQRNKTIVTSIKDDLHGTIAQVRDSLQEGLDEVRSGIEEAKEAISSTGRTTSVNVVKKGKANSLPAVPPVPKIPRTPYVTTIELKEGEGSSQKQEVVNKLKSKAVATAHQWIIDRLPSRVALPEPVSVKWLEENGAFPEPVDFSTQEIPRANTSQTDTLYTGSLKMVLTSEVQETLLEKGYSQLQELLEDHRFTTQWIITIVLFGVTLLIGLLGLLRGMVRGLSFKMPSAPVACLLPWFLITCGMK